jgi:hypothetical protein
VGDWAASSCKFRSVALCRRGAVQRLFKFSGYGSRGLTPECANLNLNGTLWHAGSPFRFGARIMIMSLAAPGRLARELKVRGATSKTMIY